MYGGVYVWIHVFLTLALVGGVWSASHPGHFTLSNHGIGDLVGHRDHLDDMKK
jgi:hypothetical protein